MFKRQCILFSLLLLTFFQIQANPITETEALQLATNFHQLRSPSKLRSADVLKLVWQATGFGLRSASESAFFIYNIGENQGFVIVSGEDAAKTILGYADEGCFNSENMPENLKNWLNFYQQEIDALRNTALTASAAASEQVSTVAAGITAVAPLLGGIKWNQTDPYNLLCPWDLTASSHTLAGCVAVAMSQIMDYYKWPVKGTGTHSYTDAKYGLQSVDFSKTTYDWSNMQDSYSSTATAQQDTAVATLIYQSGVAVDMSYSLTASTSSISKAAEAFVSYFGFDTDIHRYDRQFYSDLEWKALIKRELDIKRPILFSARSDEGGHAFVCDGYDSNNLFHINWGWGGYSNGYFELSALSSNNPGISGATGGFCYDQSILAGIHKADAVNKTSYQFEIYNTGLTPSPNSISNVKSKKFDITFGFANFGTSFTGKFAIGYFNDNEWNLLKESTSNATLATGTGYGAYTFSGISSPQTANTTFKLYALYKASDSTTWSVMHGTHDLNNSLILIVADNNTATIVSPIPIVSLTNTPISLSRLYQNKMANVDVTIQNTGSEFFSYLGFCLVSATNPNIREYICNSYVCCPAGETKTFHLTGTVTSPPGNYYLKAMFDSTNSYSKVNYKTFGPAIFNSLTLEVFPSPGTPVLRLNKNISLSNGVILSKNDMASLTVNITNTGGYFNSNISAFVFPKNGGQYSMYLTPKNTIIDSLETKEITLTGLMDVESGDYTFSLYQVLNNSWIAIAPNNFANLKFTVSVGSSELKNTDEANPFYLHEDGGRLLIETTNEIRQSELFDLSGRFIRKTRSEKSILVGDLAPGVYLMRIQTNGNYYIERFLKH